MKLDKLDFPNWPMQRLLAESCLAHNCLHPLDLMNPETSSWQRLYPVIISFLRHQVTDYDEALQAGRGDRDQLQAQISADAKRFYPWLPKERDPRTEQASSTRTRIKARRRISAQIT